MKGRYVGHILIVFKQGIATDPDKTNIILNKLTPTTPEEVMKCLGFIKFPQKLQQDSKTFFRGNVHTNRITNQARKEEMSGNGEEQNAV